MKQHILNQFRKGKGNSNEQFASNELRKQGRSLEELSSTYSN